jgi:hypothetical protein
MSPKEYYSPVKDKHHGITFLVEFIFSDDANILISDFISYHKVKVKLSHYCHAGAKEERCCSSYSFLTSALDGGEWSVSHPGGK